MSRILHVGKFFPPFAGGIENFLADLVPAQVQQGHDVAILVHDHQPRLSRFFAHIQPESHLDNIALYRAPCYGRLLYAPVSPQFPFWLKRIIRDFRPELLHFHVPNTSAFWALFLPSARRIPWIIHWHADVISTVHSQLALAYHAYRPFEQRLLAQAQAIVATSVPYLASSQALQPWLDKCHIVPLGLDKKRLPEPTLQARQWAEQQWTQPATLRILSVGRLTYYKGYETLIQAMTQVDDAQVLLVGSGELQQSLQRLIQQLNVAHKIRLLGYCTNTELTALFATCDSFCLPSVERTEAFGVVLLEAMRYGKAVIASRIEGSGVTWVVEEGKTGLLVTPQNPSALAMVLQQMVNHRDQCVTLGQAGYQRFLQQFDIQNAAGEITKLYQALPNT